MNENGGPFDDKAASDAIFTLQLNFPLQLLIF